MAISAYIFYIWMLGKVDRKILKPYVNISYSGNKIPTTMCDIPKNSEKWVESKYIKIERLGIVPGTWFGKKVNVKISNIFFHDILYTVRFVKIRRIQWYHFHYVRRVGKRPPRENTVLEFWHYVNDVIFAKLQCPVK